MNIGRKIAELCKKRGISQTELAERTGNSRFTIMNWISGKSAPSVNKLPALAQALSCPIEEFIESVEPGISDDSSLKNELITEQNVRRVPKQRSVTIPVLSREFTACCGSGLGKFDITNDVEEEFDIPMSDLRIYDSSRPPYAIYVDGDCLKSANINSDDQVIINPAEEPMQGTLALVSMYGMNSIKWLYHLNGGVIALRSDNGEVRLTPEQQEEANFFIQGVVVGIKKPRPKARPF